MYKSAAVRITNALGGRLCGDRGGGVGEPQKRKDETCDRVVQPRGRFKCVHGRGSISWKQRGGMYYALAQRTGYGKREGVDTHARRLEASSVDFSMRSAAYGGLCSGHGRQVKRECVAFMKKEKYNSNLFVDRAAAPWKVRHEGGWRLTLLG